MDRAEWGGTTGYVAIHWSESIVAKQQNAQRPKAHHKIPRFYLDGFRIEGSGTGKKARILVYRRGEQAPRAVSPRATAFETDFYSIVAPDGTRDPAMEHWLADEVDGPASAAWPKLIDPEGSLDPEERANVALFAALLFSRTSATRDLLTRAMNDLADSIHASYDAAGVEPGEVDDEPVVPLGATGQSYRITSRESIDALRIGHNEHVRLMTVASHAIATILVTMNWTILHTTAEVPFITSDHPIVRENPVIPERHRRADITAQGAEITFPLSIESCLVFSHHWPEGRIPADAESVDLVNRMVIAWAHREIYAPKASQLLMDWMTK